MLNTKTTLILTSLAAALPVAGLDAQIYGQKQATFYKSGGDSNFSAAVSANGRAGAGNLNRGGLVRIPGGSRYARGIGAEAELGASVTVLGRRLNAVRIHAKAGMEENYSKTVRPSWSELKPIYEILYRANPTVARQWYSRASQPRTVNVGSFRGARLTAELLGRTIYSKSSASSVGVTKLFGPYNLFKTTPSRTFWAGPIPVSVSGNAGVIGVANLQLKPTGTTLENFGATVSGTANGYGFGWMSAGIGGSIFGLGAEAGVRGDAKVCDAKLTATVRQTLAGSSGSVRMTLNPLRIALSVYATIHYIVDSKTWSKEIANWSAPTLRWAKSL